MRIDNKKFDACLIKAKKNVADVARELGVTPGAIYYMRYTSGNIRHKTIGKLAEALGVNGDDILVNEDPEAPPPVEPTPPPADPPKPKREAKAKEPKEAPPAWVTDYDAYFEMATAAYNDLYNNEAFIAKQMSRFAGYTAEEIKVAITASFDNFWLTEDRGWPNKVAAYKKNKVGRINWPATIAGKLEWNLPSKPKVYGGGGRFGPQDLTTPEATRRILESSNRALLNLQAKNEAKYGKLKQSE